jgi:hypothetical protein
MPSDTYIQLATLLLNHSWKGDGAEPTYPYDDPDVNAKLGIKREHGTMLRTDYPVRVPVNDRLSFGEYISACNNSTEAQIKAGVGSANGIKAWQKFCRDVICPTFNNEIERQLMEAGVHPQQTLERTNDKWHDCLHLVQGIGRVIAEEIFGETVTEESSGFLHSRVASLVDTAVVHNLDRLRRTHSRAEKKLPELQRKLDEAMKSKRWHVYS